MKSKKYEIILSCSVGIGGILGLIAIMCLSDNWDISQHTKDVIRMISAAGAAICFLVGAITFFFSHKK